MRTQRLSAFVSVFTAAFLILFHSTLLAAPSFEEKAINDVGWSVSYVGSSYDSVSDTTIFTYQVTTESWEKDLSHWVLAIYSDEVPIASGNETSFGLDPTTGIYGTKWDGGQLSGTTEQYTITVKGNVGEVQTEYSVKGGTYFAVGTTTGPGDSVTTGDSLYSISGTAYVDANGNGVLDVDEPLLTGVSVNLYDANGNVLVTLLTDANGFYSFNDLQEDSYSVNVAATGTTEDLNGILEGYFTRSNASAISVNLLGADSLNNNFGFVVSVGNLLDDFDSTDPDADGFTFTGTGKTIGYWKHQHNVAIRGKGRAHVEAAVLAIYLQAIEGLYLVDPFQFTDGDEFASSRAILSSTSSNEVDLLSKQLLGTELNHIAGIGLTGDYKKLQSVLIAWSEYLVKHNTSFTRDEILAAKDICDLINNTGN